MVALKSMSKGTYNKVHIDLSQIAMIGQLSKEVGVWFAPIAWSSSGMVLKLKMVEEADQYAIITGNKQADEERQARALYDRLIAEWKASP